ncbi:integral-membrane protein [Euzebya pacifica]|uniref:Integral-membrane protein n=1 Tax=Euzebya pacifica TaxID=1608957 RepID=A0A346Y594_9ACTN|nr:anthrone oxygenase family protein [Euzebya pacifica]AXV09641.1 integral-membrane protein [Euzebya pacifica]
MPYDIALVAAALTCSLVSGLLLGFAIVAMPGVGTLDDRGFVRAFQVMDRVIQDRQPVFMLLWAGSVVAVLAALGLGWRQEAGSGRLLLVGATVLWIGGLQVPTATINIPLNNALQAVDVAAVDDQSISRARDAFERRWNRWNRVRSAAGVLASTGFVLLLLAR